MIGDFYSYFVGVCGLPHGFRLYDQASGSLLDQAGPDARAMDDVLDRLVAAGTLTTGRYELGLAWVDRFGRETPADQRAVVAVTIGAGGVVAGQLVPATNLRVWPAAEGYVALSWFAPRRAGYDRAAAYELAEAGDLPPDGTVLDTVDGRRVSAFSVALGPFVDGQTVRVRVRASDGEVDGLRGAWVAAPPVVADAAGPDVPTARRTTLPACD